MYLEKTCKNKVKKEIVIKITSIVIKKQIVVVKYI